jgi:beta-lactamase class A
MDINSITRRHVLLGAVSVVLTANAFSKDAPKSSRDTASALAELERKSGGRLGVTMLDTATGAQTGHRTDERFAMCSTFKLPLAAIILREADQGRLRLDQFVPFSKRDIVPHAPVASKHLAKGGMTVQALSNAAQLTSDNVAANVLLSLIGGPAGFTSIVRTLGDATTRLDRTEPSMNLVTPGDVRDTTTPAAISQTIAQMLTGQWLKPASRDLLISWMIATKTGTKRLRAGFPTDWRSGDKTGTGTAPNMLDKYNDIAIVWPTGKAPVIVSAFYETAVAHSKMRDADQAVLASVGRVAAEWSRQLA